MGESLCKCGNMVTCTCTSILLYVYVRWGVYVVMYTYSILYVYESVHVCTGTQHCKFFDFWHFSSVSLARSTSAGNFAVDDALKCSHCIC